MAGGGESALLAIARTSILIKKVVGRSEKVHRIALNAMFMSRKSADGVAGFSSVTTQLRSFSKNLNERMRKIEGSIRAMVGTIGLRKKTQRFHQVVIRIPAGNASDKFARLGSDVSAMQRVTAQAVGKLEAELDRTLMFVRIGQNLAVLAKVQANVAGDQRGALRKIAEELDQAIDAIENDISGCQRQLAGMLQ